MDNWTIAFSPGDFHCQAQWDTTPGHDGLCDKPVPAGYIIARHPNWDEWMCLNCMTAIVRQHLRTKNLGQSG